MTPMPIKVLNPQRRRLLAALIANGLLQAGALIASAWFIKAIFDEFMHANSLANNTLGGYALGLFCCAAAIALLRLREHIDAEKMGQSYTHDIRNKLFLHMSQLSCRTLQQRSRGGVVLRFIGDLSALKNWISLGVARLSVAALTCAITLTALALLSPMLAIVVGTILAAGAIGALLMGGWLQNTVREARRSRYYLAANINEKITAMTAVQAYGQIRRERRRLKKQSHRLVEAMVAKARAIGAFRGMVEMVTAMASGCALIIGVLLVQQQGVTAGTIVAAMSIIGLLTPALRDLGRVQEYWHAAIVSREKITDFLQLPTLPAPGNSAQAAIKLPAGPGKLEFINVAITSHLQTLNATAHPGQVIALVGPNGAGKSTLMSLAARLLDPDHGQVKLDGIPLDSIEQRSLRQAVSMMTPDLPLMRGSVEKNLRYRLPGASDKQLQQVAELCGIPQLLAQLPRGNASRVTESGGNLSLGQRQRLGLARALLGNPRLLLLDEVDANLDPTSALALRQVIQQYAGTILLITHRLDWVMQADQVWHIAQGRLIESGPPQQLLQQPGPTAELFQSKSLRAVA